MKPLSCPSQFILWQQRAVKNNFQEKELSHNCSTLVFIWLFVAEAATVYQEPHFWRTEGQEHFAFLLDQKNFCVWIPCNAWSNLTQEIQFLEFMGGSNLTHAHSNYLICMCFIRKNTVAATATMCCHPPTFSCPILSASADKRIAPNDNMRPTLNDDYGGH